MTEKQNKVNIEHSQYSSDDEVEDMPSENAMKCAKRVQSSLAKVLVPTACKFHILSIDIGIKNLGYSIISFDKLGKKELTDLCVEFDIFDISKHLPKKTDIVSSRCEALIQFFKPLFDTYGHFKTIIIERQVNRNTMAMELMYAITMALKLLNTKEDYELVIFDPKDKFLKLGLTYSTASKSHKKQSARYARNLMSKVWQSNLDRFDKFDKKDDISDAVNQALVWMLTNGFLTLSIPQYIEVIDA